MARYARWAMMAAALGAMAGCVVPPPAPALMLGTPASLGNGTVTTYAEVDAAGAPKVIGLMFTAGAVENPPAALSDGHHCFDLNKNGKIEPEKECIPTHEYVMPLPSELARRADLPFKWVLLNWNPQGHIPPGVYDRPHFDVHFVIEPIANIFAIQSGPCGPEHVRCDQFAIARKPPPANYVPASHIDVGAVVPAMGNHLVDVAGPEFKGETFKHSWIFGAYDGRVTFYEEMVDRAYLITKPSACTPIPAQEAVATSGYYPTQSCIRYAAERNTYTVSLEGFAMRSASAPTPPRPAPPPPPGRPPRHS